MDAAQAQEFIERLTGAVVGGWLLSEYLGKGKSAVVMRGQKSGQEAAVKVFHRELVERFGKDAQLTRIRRELTLVGTTHPNVVEILDGGECTLSGDLYVVMELLPWENLKEARDSIPPSDIPNIVGQMAAGAEHLEGMGLAHRDIKPENIAISPDRKQIKLLDLGVIKPFSVNGLTDVASRPFIGTLQYSSPEYLLREEDDTVEGWRALTFYQIGAVMHDLIMQKELFGEYVEPFARLVRAIIEKTPDVAGGDPNLVTLCKYCLVKDPLTRLELVNWNSFRFNNKRAEELAKLGERLKLRQKYEVSRVASGKGVLGGEVVRLRRQVLENACSRLDFQLSLINKINDIFPLCSTVPSVSAVDGVCSCLLTYEKDEGLGLDISMKVEVKLRLVDENNGDPIFQLTGNCIHLLGSSGGVSIIGTGNISNVLSEESLGGWLLEMVDRTYRYIDEGKRGG
ncbi:protein kinase [Stenotrophomonas acidaminiphila]|uniref:protein kinase domain-containing protein n=1 Tax=Stenotrophomonas acidaminiphila TaxID=128780 RepID=UPI0028A7CA51|nr:protein kinase [Stenotrophomonas acidaminiphila]